MHPPELWLVDVDSKLTLMFGFDNSNLTISMLPFSIAKCNNILLIF